MISYVITSFAKPEKGSIADVGMPDNCAENCRFAAGCMGWSYRKSRYECYLHTSTNRRERETGWICGDQKNNKVSAVGRLISLLDLNYVESNNHN